MEEPETRIRIVTILGSVRAGNMTGKALRLLNDEVGKHERVTLDFIDPATLELAPPGKATDGKAANRLKKSVRAATGIVLATPEYHGSFSSVMKLVIENLGFPSELSGKPIALLGVAAGAIGAIKSLEHLRSVCSHVGGIVLPGPVSVAGVGKVFDEAGNCTDPAVEKQIRAVATNLIDYIHQNVCPRVALESMVRGAA